MNTQKITQLRKLSGYTQQEMADKLNKSLSSYNRLERGETAMTINDIDKISHVFNIPIADLLQTVMPVSSMGQNASTDSDQIEKLFKEIHEIKAMLKDLRNAAA